jgi:hypothetical protein
MARTLLSLDRSEDAVLDRGGDEDGVWVVQTVDSTCEYCSVFVWLAGVAAAVVILITLLVLIYVYRQATKLRASNAALGVHVNPACYEIEKDRDQLEGHQHRLGHVQRHVHTPSEDAISVDRSVDWLPQKDPSVIVLQC